MITVGDLQAMQDVTTGALLTIETVHHEVHEGEMYHAA